MDSLATTPTSTTTAHGTEDMMDMEEEQQEEVVMVDMEPHREEVGEVSGPFPLLYLYYFLVLCRIFKVWTSQELQSARRSLLSPVQSMTMTHHCAMLAYLLYTAMQQTHIYCLASKYFAIELVVHRLVVQLESSLFQVSELALCIMCEDERGEGR